MYGIDLTDLTPYQKEKTKDDNEKKICFAIALCDALAMFCCYILLTVPQEHISNHIAGFGIYLYVLTEIVGAIVVGGLLLTMKAANLVKKHAEVSFNDEAVDLEDKYNKIFEPFYRTIGLANSKIHFTISLIVDILVFVGLVAAGWLFIPVVHAMAVLLIGKEKGWLFPIVMVKLKNIEAPEKEETIDELADKLFNG